MPSARRRSTRRQATPGLDGRQAPNCALMTSPRRTARRAGGRPADAPLLHVPLDPRDARPLYRQLYDGLRDAILECRLAPGARLPSTRALAADLGLARTTVTLAFDQLRVEGYVVGCRGGGTRVRESVPD